MARYGNEYGREYDAWGGAGQWGRGAGQGGVQRQQGSGRFEQHFGQGRSPQGYRMEQESYDQDYFGADRYGYEDWGERQRRMPSVGGYGGYQGGGYRTFQPQYGGDYASEGGMRRGGYQAGMAGGSFGYDTGYTGGYEHGYSGGLGTSRMQNRSNRMSSARVSEIMTENPEVVTPDTTISEAAQRMKELNVGIIPVVESTENRRLRGVITDRDITIRAVAAGKDGKAKVSDCMSEDVQTVNKNDRIDRVMQVMESEQVRRVPVTDREGRVVGIVAQADLAVDFAGSRNEEHRVHQTLERISEPARPERKGETSMAAKGRSDQQRSSRSRNQQEENES